VASGVISFIKGIECALFAGVKCGEALAPHPIGKVPRDLPPRIGSFGQTGTLGDLIHRPLPTPLSLFHGLQHANPIGRVVFGNRKLYGLTRTRQRFRCLKIGNRFIGTLTALVLFVIAGKIGVAIDLVRQRVKFAHT
jgi:hypothetical protein